MRRIVTPAASSPPPVKAEQVLGQQIGKRIIWARNLLFISQKELNRAARLGSGHLSHIEAGSRPKVRRATIQSIVDGLDLFGIHAEVDWILEGKGERPYIKDRKVVMLP